MPLGGTPLLATTAASVAGFNPVRMAHSEISYDVRRLPIERTLELRRAVLRPHLPEHEPYVTPDDHLPTTIAFGAVTPEDLVICVARLTPEVPPFQYGGAPDRCAGSWRLRGMATSFACRGLGVGSAVMAALIAHVGQAGGGVLWCNARVAAVSFYERSGLRRWGGEWQEPEIGPHVVMWREVAPS